MRLQRNEPVKIVPLGVQVQALRALPLGSVKFWTDVFGDNYDTNISRHALLDDLTLLDLGDCLLYQWRTSASVGDRVNGDLFRLRGCNYVAI